MKVVVTGANGYLGTGIVEALCSFGVEVLAVGVKTDKVCRQVKTLNVDIFDIENVMETFGYPDCVLHLAWRNGFIHNDMSHLIDLPKHVEFIKKLLDSNLSQLVIMGSMHEVGFHEGSVNENTICRPETLYGISKNALREAVFALGKDAHTKIKWLRGFYIVSASEEGSSVFSKVIQKNNHGDKFFPFTSGKNQYDFLDYDAFCFRTAAAVIDDSSTGIINICSGYPESLGSRMERFISEHNLEIELDYGAYPDRPYDSLAVWGDSKRINEILTRLTQQ